MAISKVHRDMFWDWNLAWGDQKPDQHVREWIKQDDYACEQALISEWQAEEFYAMMCVNPSLREQVEF